MQIVILAAGASSRFFPLCGETHKSMFSLCGKPILAWTLESLKKAGLKDILIISNTNDENLNDFVKKYKGLKITLTHQKKPLGMGNALTSAKGSLDKSFILMFPHHINADILIPPLLETSRDKVAILADKTNESWKYGILKVRGKKALGIVEKPKKGKEPSKIRASGIYLLTKDFITTLENTPQEEYQFEAALDKYMKEKEVRVVYATNPILPLKYPWDLFSIGDYLFEKMKHKISKRAYIAKTATVRGKVVIEEGSKIHDYALIEGPIYIGKDAVIGAHCILRSGSILEEGAEIQRYVDCTRSIIGPNSHVHSGFVGDSIFGSNIRVGASFVTANRRMDRKEIYVKSEENKIPTGKNYLGAVVGDNVKMGINVSTMPGVLIGSDSSIGPGTTVLKTINPRLLSRLLNSDRF